MRIWCDFDASRIAPARTFHPRTVQSQKKEIKNCQNRIALPEEAESHPYIYPFSKRNHFLDKPHKDKSHPHSIQPVKANVLPPSPQAVLTHTKTSYAAEIVPLEQPEV